MNKEKIGLILLALILFIGACIYLSPIIDIGRTEQHQKEITKQYYFQLNANMTYKEKYELAESICTNAYNETYLNSIVGYKLGMSYTQDEIINQCVERLWLPK